MKKHTIYTDSLNHVIDELFQHAYDEDMTINTLSTKSGLSYVTVRRLAERKTKYPQYRTVQLLAHALGGSVQFRAGKLGKRQFSWTPKVFAA